MKIAYKKEIKTFDEIECGQVFESGYVEFMKIDNTEDFNAVRLDDGSLFFICGDDLCEPLDATLVIE